VDERDERETGGDDRAGGGEDGGQAKRSSSTRPVTPEAMALVTVAGRSIRPAPAGVAPSAPWK